MQYPANLPFICGFMFTLRNQAFLFYEMDIGLDVESRESTKRTPPSISPVHAVPQNSKSRLSIGSGPHGGIAVPAGQGMPLR